jgi:replicative DNA helicase
MPEEIIIPSAPISERAILALMLDKPEVWIPRVIGDGVETDHFYIHGALFAILVRRHRDGESLDFSLMLPDEMAKGNLEAVGGPSEVTEIFTSCRIGDGARYEEHLKRLRESLARRRAVIASTKLAQITDASSADEVRQAVSSVLEGVTNALSAPKGMVTAKEAAKAFLARLEEAYHNGDLPGASTGMPVLDAASGGLKPGELWVIGAETSGGKSVLMLQMAAHLASEGKRVLVFSLEMTASEVAARMTSYHGRIPYGHITMPRTASKFSLGKIQSTVEEICKWDMMIEDRPKRSASKIEAECIRRRDSEGKIDLVVVDYLQIMEGERGRNESRQEEVSRTSKALKNLAKTLSCPVVTASQLNDDGKIREARDPAFDADAVFLIGNDGIKVAKLRNAPRGQVLPLVLNGEFQRFVETVPQEEPTSSNRQYRTNQHR